MKPFRVGILCYIKRFQEINNLAKYVPPTLMKGNSFDEYSWKVHGKESYEHGILVAIKDGLSSSIQYELKDNHDYYSSFILGY